MAARFHVGFSSRSLLRIEAHIKVLWMLKNSEATCHLTCVAKKKQKNESASDNEGVKVLLSLTLKGPQMIQMCWMRTWILQFSSCRTSFSCLNGFFLMEFPPNCEFVNSSSSEKDLSVLRIYNYFLFFLFFFVSISKRTSTHTFSLFLSCLS